MHTQEVMECEENQAEPTGVWREWSGAIKEDCRRREDELLASVVSIML